MTRGVHCRYSPWWEFQPTGGMWLNWVSLESGSLRFHLNCATWRRSESWICRTTRSVFCRTLSANWGFLSCLSLQMINYLTLKEFLTVTHVCGSLEPKGRCASHLKVSFFSECWKSLMLPRTSWRLFLKMSAIGRIWQSWVRNVPHTMNFLVVLDDFYRSDSQWRRIDQKCWFPKEKRNALSQLSSSKFTVCFHVPTMKMSHVSVFVRRQSQLVGGDARGLHSVQQDDGAEPQRQRYPLGAARFRTHEPSRDPGLVRQVVRLFPQTENFSAVVCYQRETLSYVPERDCLSIENESEKTQPRFLLHSPLNRKQTHGISERSNRRPCFASGIEPEWQLPGGIPRRLAIPLPAAHASSQVCI